jgi:hypothetical protein
MSENRTAKIDGPMTFGDGIDATNRRDKNRTSSSTSATARRGFCAQFPGRSGPTDNNMIGTSFRDHHYRVATFRGCYAPIAIRTPSSVEADSRNYGAVLLTLPKQVLPLGFPLLPGLSLSESG